MLTDIWRIEQGFWNQGGKSYYRQHMHEKALFVFEQGVGILTAQQVLDAVPEENSEWKNVSFSSQKSSNYDDFIVLAYTAYAKKKDGSHYGANCSSTYIKSGANWMLTSHQQTPLKD